MQANQKRFDKFDPLIMETKWDMTQASSQSKVQISVYTHTLKSIDTYT